MTKIIRSSHLGSESIYAYIIFSCTAKQQTENKKQQSSVADSVCNPLQVYLYHRPLNIKLCFHSGSINISLSSFHAALAKHVIAVICVCRNRQRCHFSTKWLPEQRVQFNCKWRSRDADIKRRARRSRTIRAETLITNLSVIYCISIHDLWLLPQEQHTQWSWICNQCTNHGATSGAKTHSTQKKYSQDLQKSTVTRLCVRKPKTFFFYWYCCICFSGCSF